MAVVELIGWSFVSAAVAWGMTVCWATRKFGELRRSMQEEVEHWKGEAARATDVATQLKHEIATWSRGARQGREDVIALVPLIVAAHQRLTETGADVSQADPH